MRSSYAGQHDVKSKHSNGCVMYTNSARPDHKPQNRNNVLVAACLCDCEFALNVLHHFRGVVVNFQTSVPACMFDSVLVRMIYRNPIMRGKQVSEKAVKKIDTHLCIGTLTATDCLSKSPLKISDVPPLSKGSASRLCDTREEGQECQS